MFSYGFGIYEDLGQWTGGPYVQGAGAYASEVVSYRFFGPDSVRFNSSLSLRFGTRANDTENILYYYTDLSVEQPKVETPEEWTLSGPYEILDYGCFEEELPDDVENGIPEDSTWGKRKLSAIHMKSEHAWVDFARWFRRNRSSNVGTQSDKCAVYARTVIASPQEKLVTVRLSFDDWMRIWLNGEPVASFQHDSGFEVCEVDPMLKKGNNSLVIRLSNFNNIEWRCWAFSCTIKSF